MSLTKVERIALDRAITLLRSLKAQYKIILPDGTEYGELVVAPLKAKRNSKHPRGEMSAYFQPLLENLQPGEVRTIPADKYGPVDLRATLSGWCTGRWGKGNAITSVDHKTNSVEVMRVA